MDKPMISVDPAVFVRLLTMAQAKHADDGVFLENIAAALAQGAQTKDTDTAQASGTPEAAPDHGPAGVPA